MNKTYALAATGTSVLAWLAAMLITGGLGLAIANAQSVSGITSEMSPGDSGTQVSALQTFLASDSSIYPEGLVTGYYGSLTVSAVQRYQCAQGIVCSGSPSTTGYGRVGPATLAHILGGGTISSGADLSAPILTQPAVTNITSGAVSINWQTNEPAHSAVLYSTAPPALSAASFAAMSRVDDTSFGSSANVSLTGLLPHTVYYFVIESVDASGNIQYGINHSFTTL